MVDLSSPLLPFHRFEESRPSNGSGLDSHWALASGFGPPVFGVKLLLGYTQPLGPGSAFSSDGAYFPA